MKKLLSILLIALALCFVGCSKSKTLDVSSAKDYFNQTLTTFDNATSADFKVTLQKGDEVSTIDVKYAFENGKVTKMQAVSKDASGEVYVVVLNSKVYLKRYNNPESSLDLTDEESKTIAESYGFSAYMERVKDIYSSAFFVAVTSSDATSEYIKLTCDLENLELPEDVEDEKIISMQEDIDALKAMKEVTLELTVANEMLTKMVGTYVSSSDVKSVITIEFNSYNQDVSVSRNPSAIYG